MSTEDIDIKPLIEEFLGHQREIEKLSAVIIENFPAAQEHLKEIVKITCYADEDGIEYYCLHDTDRDPYSISVDGIDRISLNRLRLAQLESKAKRLRNCEEAADREIVKSRNALFRVLNEIKEIKESMES